MPRKKTPQPCACRCGGTTAGGVFLAGHDQKLRIAIENHVGGILLLRDIVEAKSSKEVKVPL